MKTFKAQQSTTASKETIWQIWMDVANWHEWDTELTSASAPAQLKLHATGALKPKAGPKSQFVINEFTDGASFTFRTKLPLATLDVAHYFVAGDETIFVHEVTFGGLMGAVFGRILGRQFSMALPDVLIRIKRLAERQLS